MPFDSEGRFTRKYNWEEDRVNDISIDSHRMDEEFNNYADGLGETFLKDGRTPMQGTFNAGGFNVRNMADGRQERDAITLNQLTAAKTELTTLVTTTKDELTTEFNESLENELDVIKNGEGFTDTGKQNITRLGMPDYNSVVTISSGYIAPSNGFYFVHIGTKAVGNITIGNYSKSFNHDYNYTENSFSCYPVPKGQKITFSGVTVQFVKSIGG